VGPAQVVSHYDPGLAPPGKPLLLAGPLCPSDAASEAVPMPIRQAEAELFQL